MNQQVFIPTALSLPAPDIEALIEGRNITAISPIFLNPGRQFALYPADTSRNILPTEQYYRPNFLPTAQKTLTNLGATTVIIKGWAKCELCQTIDNPESLDILSQLTIWTEEALRQIISQRGHIFLAYLRVYRLPKPVEIPVNPSPKFIPIAPPLTVTDTTPILSDRIFAQRRHQLEYRIPPTHPELEELQGRIAILSTNNLAAKQFDQNIKIFLGWASHKSDRRWDSDLVWIHKIAEVGNSSDGNYFEKLVRKGLIKLGFTNSNLKREASLDPEATGGAGGLDFYCEAPYPVVGECKATKTEKVPDSTPAQLIKLGHKHLKENYDSCIKIILAAGELTKPALQTAEGNKISVISPETLQSLVEMQAHHQGSIDLMKLKEYLKNTHGLADEKVREYLAEIRQNLSLRSHLVKLVKQHLEKTGDETIEVAALYGAYGYSNPPLQLTREEMHEILIELSSPLTGYLGRKKGDDWQSDRFYFLRELS